MARDLAARTSQALAQQTEQPTLTQLIERMKPEIQRALPRHMDSDRLARIAITTLRQNPGLGKCTPASFLGALMTCSQLGLEPGPLGEAYLVPFGNEVTFIPGYRGLIKLAWQSGQMSSIAAHVVHEQDEFDFEYGLEPFLRHKPTMTGDPGAVIAVYAAATFKNGGNAFVVMSRADVEEIRKSSRSGSSGSSPWVKHWDAMARKTAIRQLIRYLPLSSELENLARADSLDESTRTDVAPIDEAQPAYLTGEVIDTEQGATDAVTGEVLDDPAAVEDAFPPDPEDQR